jgi:RNA polymerase sigma-70 factor (ECF subfamily)
VSDLKLDIKTDEAIIVEILEQENSKLFGVLYERYERKVFNKCYSIIKDKSDTEELVQEIFLKVFTNLKGFKNASSFSTWLYAITYRSCIDYLRELKKTKFDKLGVHVELSENTEDVEDEEILAIKKERLAIILDQLHPIDKAVLLMKYQDGLKLKVIQEALTLSDSATKMKINRAKLKVVKLYQKLYPKG